MTARGRVVTVVAAAAVVVAAGTVGATLLQSRGQGTTEAGAVTKPQPGVPPLFFDFGVRSDRQVADLTHGAALLKHGHRAAAARIFARYRSVQAQIGAAFARWPNGSLDDVKDIVAAHPADPVAQLQLGYALFWSGRVADAASRWQQVARRFPDTPEAVEAQTVLFPKIAPGLPYIVTTVAFPKAPSVAAQLRLLARAARRPDAQAKLRYGLALWRLWHPVAARKQLQAAARLAPDDATVQTAAAVSLFAKPNPTAAFAHLGPLTARFPKAAVVRFHLGLLLVWVREPKKALAQLRLAVADEPNSVYAREARTLIGALGKDGTK